MKKIAICIDFDGTCVSHEFPNVGENIGAVEVLRELINAGHHLILFTMRSNSSKRKYLDEALDWFNDNEIELYGIQSNPTQHAWTSSPKAYGQIYIDDAALGCPLKHDENISLRPFVDWDKVREILKFNEVL